MLRSNSKCVQARRVLVRYASWKLLHQQPSYLHVSVLRGKHERSVVIGIAAYLYRLMASYDQVLGYLCEAICGSEVQTRAAFVFEVRVLDELRIVADYALHEKDIVQEDGAPQARRSINPGLGQFGVLSM